VKTTEESGRIKGYDGGKQVKGRKRHLLVDTLGLLLSVYVTPANTSDQEGARRLLIGLKPLQPTFKGVWSRVVNCAPLPPPNTRLGQYPRRHRRADDNPGYHVPGG
jgi:transposase